MGYSIGRILQQHGSETNLSQNETWKSSRKLFKFVIFDDFSIQ